MVQTFQALHIENRLVLINHQDEISWQWISQMLLPLHGIIFYWIHEH
jgi:hypothetical protein